LNVKVCLYLTDKNQNSVRTIFFYNPQRHLIEIWLVFRR